VSGRYRIDRLIGAGGSAEVYAASVLGAGGFMRRVALKRLKAELAREPEWVAEFEAEARLASRLHHANVVAVLDYGTLEGRPFQVLEYVDGVDLLGLEAEARTQRVVLPPSLWLAVLAEAAHGLDYVHDARDEAGRPLGLVHRDVTPANILVAWTGDVKLADFGIAFSRGPRQHTRVGVVKGKQAYLSPEQQRGAPVSAATDVFALGCVLHRVLTGRGLLDDEAARRALLLGEPPALDPSLPADLAALVSAAVAPDPARRTRSAAAFAEACTRWLAAEGVLDGRVVVRERLGALRPTAASRPEDPLATSPRGALAELGAAPELSDDAATTGLVWAPPAGLGLSPLPPAPTVVSGVASGPREDSPAAADDTDPRYEDSEATRAEPDPGAGAPTEVGSAVPMPPLAAWVPEDAHPTRDLTAPRLRHAEDTPESDAEVVGSDELVRAVPVGEPLPYDVIEPLAEGGFAEVFRARRKDGTGGVVALKLLRADKRDNLVVSARFEREAALLSRLDSPYLVRLLDSGRQPDGRPWLAMELLAGRTLGDEVTAARTLSPSRVRRLARDLALGLAALHEAGIVHRDLSARNVMVVEHHGREKAVIIDLGHARWAEAQDGVALTRPGLMLGNARWMAPEQIHAPSAVGPAADLYSLGLLMLAMLTGRAPFVGSPTTVLAQQLRALPEIPPGPFAAIIRRLVDKDPARRHSSAAAVAAELTQLVVRPEALVSGVPVTEPPRAAAPPLSYDDRTVPSPPRPTPRAPGPPARAASAAARSPTELATPRRSLTVLGVLMLGLSLWVLSRLLD
jgi:serine/threonine protein kinase